MATNTSASSLVLLAVVLQVIIAAIITPCLSDPDPLQDFCVADWQAGPPLNGFPCKLPASVVVDDFFTDMIVAPASTANPFGANTTRVTPRELPGLNTQGVAIGRIDLAVGGLNTPHTHPRASELVLVLKGEIMVGFTTSGNQLFSRVLTEGELFIVPRGLMHFQLNVGNTSAVCYAIFDSQAPGTLTSALSLFATSPTIPNQVLAKALLMDEGEVVALKSKFAPLTPPWPRVPVLFSVCLSWRDNNSLFDATPLPSNRQIKQV